MKPELQLRVQRYGWDKAAAHYESSWQRQLRPSQEALLEMADLKPGERVLDVACGSGLVTFPAAEAVGSDGTVVATDLSDGMIEVARAVARERRVDNVSFDQMGAEALDLPDISFDAVLCSLGLMYVPDPAQALREMYRVVAAGGRAVASVWGERRNCGWAEVFPIVDRKVRTEVCPLFFQLGTGTALQAVFQQAGFTRVTSRRIQTRLRYGSAEEACIAIFAGGPVALAYNRFDEETRKGVHAEYLASIEPYRIGSVYEIPGEFVVTCGYRAT